MSAGPGRRRTLPNFGYFQQAYIAARQANDEFAAQFYLDRFPPAERAAIEAEAIVAPLVSRFLLRDDVLAALAAQQVINPDFRAECLQHAARLTDRVTASEIRFASWKLVRYGEGLTEDYRRGLRLALEACRRKPRDGECLTTLGVAQYRNGHFVEALASLSEANQINQQTEPGDLTFLTLAQQQLGQYDQARETLQRLRDLMQSSRRAYRVEESQAFLREAETIELDGVFPADPFAR